MDLTSLKDQLSRFVELPLEVELSHLSEGDRRALVPLIEAAAVYNDLYMTQLWSKNHDVFAGLQKDSSALGKMRRRLYWFCKGPWFELDDHRAFLPDVPARKPKGANFYPEDMSQEEFETFVKGLPPEEQKRAQGFFSVIRRDSRGKLFLVPYSEEYGEKLGVAGALLREAAALTDNSSLKKFLLSRADAFESNDYFDSDVAWMDLDAPVELTMGPYEVYTDELFGYKAAFEAYVTVRDDQETERLSAFAKHLQEIEDHLPIPARYRNPKLGGAAPIRVVQEIYDAGDASHGVHAAAFNLPNDERVIQQKGCKRVMLKNIQEAKFKAILTPISKNVLESSEQCYLDFESFFLHILCHELMHGLGPHQIEVAGRATTTRNELKDTYSAIEEAKADVLGLFSLQYFMTHAKKLGLDRVLDSSPEAERKLYTTFLASSFRTLRFGVHEAHGRGMALQLNYFMDHQAIEAKGEGKFVVHPEKMKAAVTGLAGELLMIEAEGSREKAQQMLTQLGVLRPELQAALDHIHGIPTDITLKFVTAQELVGHDVL